MKTVIISCFDSEREYPLFSLEFTTAEYRDLITFVMQDLTGFEQSKWLQNIRKAIYTIKDGYFIDGEFRVYSEIKS